ncbi:hypothetical protein SAMN05443579_11083 [Variovorax sp. PDC80]|nr:hypothetical protein SAMN05443579_11083 [Variovorax sp. PDC80]
MDSGRLTYRVVLRLRLTCAVLCVAAALSSCTWVAPIPKVDDQGYFNALASGRENRSLEELSIDCRERIVAIKTPDCLAAGLGTVWAKQDAYRRELLNMARDVINVQATYNTLIYPFGAVTAYESLRGGSNRGLLLSAVAGTAIYALLNSGIPEREKQYLRAAGEMQCSMSWHAQWLYLNSDLYGFSTPDVTETRTFRDDAAPGISITTVQRVAWSRDTGRRVSLEDAESALSTSIENFQIAQASMIAKLRGKPGSGPARGALERVKFGDGTRGSNTTPQVAQRLNQQVAQARATLKALRRLRGDIEDAAMWLSQDADWIRADLQRRLGEKQPALRTPQEIGKLFEALGTQSARGQSGEDVAGLMNLEIPLDLSAGLDAASAGRLAAFYADTGGSLLSAWGAAQAWVDEQARREARSRTATRGLPCADSTLLQIDGGPRSSATGGGGSNPSSRATQNPLPP